MSSSKTALWRLNGPLFVLTALFVVVWLAPAFYTVQGLASYLPLHMAAETFSIVISMLVFGVAWNVYSAERPGNFVILACALLAVGLIDFAHMLSFKGMPDFITPSGPEKAINLWLAARLIAALTLFTLSLRHWQPLRHPQNRYGLLAGSLAVSAIVIWSGLAHPEIWPRTFVAGQGLTAFKIAAEYSIIALLIVPAVQFYRQSRRPQPYDVASLFAATVVTILSELCFTLYSDVADIFNLLGHIYKVVAYIYIYRAVFMGSVREPFLRLDAEVEQNRRIAKELRTASIYTRSLIEASLDPLVTISSDGKITDVNHATEKATGRSRSELIGTDFSDYFTEPDLARKGYQRVFNDGFVTDYPLAMRHRDGLITEVLYNASIYRDETGKVLGVFAAARDITEQRRAELARSLLAAIVESSSDAIIGKTPDGIITSWNIGAERIYGYAAAEIVGKHITTLAPAELHAEINDFLDVVRKGGAVANHETQRIRKDGTRINVALTLSPIRDAVGNISGISTIARDITERKRAEEALFAAQQIFRTLVENSPDIITRYDRDCRRTYVNPTYLKVAQIPEQELLGTAPVQRSPLPGSSANALQDLLRRVLDTGTAEAIDVVWPMADNINHWYNISAFPEFDREGSVVSTMTISRDITQRKRAEELLRQSESRYRSLIQNIQAAVVVHGADTRILVSNALAQEILGLSEDQMTGRTAFDPSWHFFCEDGAAAAIEEYPVNRVLSSRQPVRNLVLGLHRADHVDDVWVLVNGDPVLGEDGQIIEIIVTFIDITGRKRMEAALRDSEERFRGMFQNHHAVMLLIEPETGKILDANRAAADYYGYPVETLTGMTIQDINMMRPEEVALEREKAAREKRNYFVFPHRLANGEIRTVEVHSSPIMVHGKSILFSVTHDITARRQAEENLKRVNERFSLAARAAEFGVWDWDVQNNALVWDDRMYALYGIRREDFTGAYDAWLQGVHPDDRARSNEEIQRALRGEREFDTEFRVLWPDGSVHFIRAYSLVVRDDKGTPLRMTGVNFDTTERKRAEETLRREQALLNRIMVTSPVGIAVVDKAGQITFANPQAERILGLGKEEITQRSYNAPEWRTTAIDGGPFSDEEQPFSRVMAARQPVFDVQHAIEWPDGRRVMLSINGAPLFDAEGDIEAVAFAIEDITERKRVEDALVFVAQRGWQISGENFFDALAQFLGERLDMDYVLIDRIDENPDMAETVALYAKGAITPNMRYALKGTPCENVMGKSLCVYSHGIQQLFPEDTLLPGMGAESYIGIPLWDSTGRPIGLIAVMGSKPLADGAQVTQLLQLVATRAAAELERKKAEDEIRKLNQELEHRVADRTSQLEAANKELEAFSYSVSHDLRTPLRAIDGFSHILQEDYADKLDDEGRRVINVVRDSAARMGHLIDDILQFSRTGRLELNSVEIDMASLAREVLEELKPVFAGGKLQVEIGNIPSATGDRAMLRQVFVNLLSNALKFSRHGDAAKVQVGGSVENGETIYFVRDNGVGFDMQYASKLFGVFQRLHSEEEFEGTGIGLAIVKRIVTRHGGRVWAEAQLNKGATFFFALPIRQK